MLTIKAEIKRQEQKADGTYNIKVRFTLNRKVKRLSTSLFIKPSDLTKTGNFKKGTAIYKEIEQLVTGYQQKCDAMQVDINGYTLDEIFKRLKFGEQKDKEIDFIQFSRQWIAKATIKGASNYKTVINSLISFMGKEELNIKEVTVSFINKYTKYLNQRRNERIKELEANGKRIPSRNVQVLQSCKAHSFDANSWKCLSDRTPICRDFGQNEIISMFAPSLSEKRTKVANH